MKPLIKIPETLDLRLRERSHFPSLSSVLQEHRELFEVENKGLYSEKDYEYALIKYEYIIAERYWREYGCDLAVWNG